MTEYNIPSAKEIEAIERRARQLQADTMASGVRSVFRRMSRVAFGGTLRGGAHS